jgi:arylsulfatase
MVYTFDKANADAPSRHHTQYFEMAGVQGLYNDGWMLSAVPIRAPWELVDKPIENPATAYKMELYDVRHDWTQYTDVAAANPTRMQEMKDLMFAEFAKYQVLPLDASVAARLVTVRPSVTAGRKVFTYSTPVTGLPSSVAPRVLNTSYTITADIDVPQGGGDGSIVSEGGRFGGYGMYLLKGKPIFTWNLLGLQRVRWESPRALSPGRHTIVFDFKYNGLGFATLAFNNLSGIGRPGTGTLTVDGLSVTTQTMERTVPLALNTVGETFDIGSKTGTPVDDRDYQIPFTFTGKINKLTFSVEPPVLTLEDEKKLRDAQRAAQDAK